MELRILAIGDVVGEVGLDCLHRHLRKLKKEHQIDFTIANGENCAGIGLLPRHAEELLDAGVDVITLGNHTFSRQQIAHYLDDNSFILRPGNFSPSMPGRGMGIYEGPKGLSIAVLNLMARVNVDPHLSSPFTMVDAMIKEAKEAGADIVLLDFHGEITSEKGAMAFYVDGRLNALWGTHTHIPTADTQILPKGTGFVTDLGMVGPKHSVLGVRPEDSINLFLGGMPRRFEGATGPCRLGAVIFVIDTDTGRCTKVTRCDIVE